MRPLLCVLLCAGCSAEQVFVEPEPSLERMLSQPRYDPYEASDFFAAGRTMQTPPEHTVAIDAELDLGTAKGYAGTSYVTQLPVKPDRAVLERGRSRFEVYCAACHGILGDGESVVGRNMALVKPRSLHLEQVRQAPDGKIFRVASEGYGLMPGYAGLLSMSDRWAVVAYVRALQLSQRAALADLPNEVRARAVEALR